MLTLPALTAGGAQEPPSPPPPVAADQQPDRPNRDNKSLSRRRERGKHPKKHKENPEFAAAAKRFINALGRRVLTDPDALAFLLDVERHLQKVTGEAARGLHYGSEAEGRPSFSWAEIGKRVGLTRQACRQRWGDR